MTFRWADYHALSADLIENYPPGLSEAAFRCALSRSYYAVFCTARDRAVENNELVPEETGRDHWNVMLHYKKSDNNDRHMIGVWLDRLLDDRHAADYDATIEVGRKWAEGNVELARRALSRLQKL